MEGDRLPKKQLKEIFCTWKTEGFTTHPACWVETKPQDTSEKRFKTLVAKRRRQLGRKQRPTQDPLLVPQVKVKSEKDLHNSFLLIYLFFNWSITALQNFVVFCQTSTWINHMYTYVLLKMTSENFVSSNPHCAVVTGGHFQTCTVLGTF